MSWSRPLVVSAITTAVLAVAAVVVTFVTPFGQAAGVTLVLAAGDGLQSGSGSSPGATPAAATPAGPTAMEKTVQVLKRRLRELGAGESALVWNPPPSGTVSVELRGVRDLARTKNVLLQSARLEMKLVVQGPASDRSALLTVSNGVLVPGQAVVSGTAQDGSPPMWYLVDDTPVVSGRDIETARPTVDETNQPAISFRLTTDGTERFGAVTTANVGRRLAILLNNQVMSAPVIEAPITSRDARITGSFTREEALDLSLLLRTGMPPVQLHVVEQRELAAAPGRPTTRLTAFACAIVFMVATVMLLAFALDRRATPPAGA